MTLRIGHLAFDHVVYDDRHDVLYLSIGKPQDAADSFATTQGHVLRYDAAGEIIGLTIVNAKWLSERGGVEIPIHVAPERLAEAFA